MSRFVRDTVRPIIVVIAFICCAVIGVVRYWLAYQAGHFAMDFAVFWRVATEAPELAYRPHPNPFPYAPTGLLWFWPLGLLSFAAGYLALSLLSLSALWLVCRRHLTGWAIALLLVSAPLLRCIRNGQVSAIVAAAVIWACGSSNRLAAGIAFGAVASLKPQLVVMAPLMMVLNRDWRAFVASVTTFLSLVLTSILIFGFGRWPEWLASLGHFRQLLHDYGVLSIAVSPAGMAAYKGLPQLPFLLLGLVGGIALVFVCRNAEPLEKAAAIGLGSILASPYALEYDLVVVVPLVAALFVQGRYWTFPALTLIFNPLPLIVVAGGLVRRGRAPEANASERQHPAV